MVQSQVVLVTGSSSGFGFLTAQTLARQGYIVFATMRDPQRSNEEAAHTLQKIAQEEQLHLRILELDVTSDSAVTSAVQDIIQQTGQINVVINNAGKLYRGLLETFSPEQVNEAFNTNVTSVTRVNRAVLPYMRTQKSGLLISITSIVGRFFLPFNGLYAATKTALEALTEVYRYELAQFGIDAAIIEPGTHATNVRKYAINASDNERAEHYHSFRTRYQAEQKSLAHMANPQNIADAVRTLIETPAGKRPLRTVVAPDAEAALPRQINAAIEPLQQQILEQRGIAPLVTFGKDR